MIRKLQQKFVLAAMLSLLIVLVVLIGVINVLNYRSVIKEADEVLQMLSDDPGERFLFDGKKRMDDREPDDGKGRGERRMFNGETPFQWRFFTVTCSETGETSAVNLKNVATVDEETAILMAEQAAKKDRDCGFLNGYRYLRVQEEAQTRWIFLNLERELATAREFLLTSGAISLVGYVMVFLLLVLLSARIVRPIAQSYEKQKQFITDAGHELKTPITIIRADTDVIAEDQPDNEWLNDIRTQTDRLSTLTNDLIYLSKMEESVKPLMMDFPLSEVVQESAQPFSAIARTQDKSFSVDIQPLLTLHGEEKSIRKLVSILLDNAMKYSPRQGAIALSLKKNGKQIKLSVVNTVETIEKGSADRLFDRFYRADASRNSETGGFGLGLAIAKAVTEAHRGRIHAFSADGRSLTVEAVFTE